MHCSEKTNVIHGIEKDRGQINIKGFTRLTKARYKSSKSVIEKVMNIKQIKIDWRDSKILNLSLNEGITEWIKQKGIKDHETYYKEVNIVEQIENIIGASPIVETVNRNPKKMHTLLNMKQKEFLDFCNEMYYISFLDELKNKIEDSIADAEKFDKLTDFNEGEGGYINDEINEATIRVQNQLIQKLIIPSFEKENNHSEETFEKSLQCMKLIMNYCNNANAYTDVFENLSETKQYKKLKSLLDKEVVQFAIQNIDSIDKWDKEKIFEIDNKIQSYGYIHFDDYDERYDAYIDFMQKLSDRKEEERLHEDNAILDKVKQYIGGKDKIDVNVLINGYCNEYSSFDIEDKVRELVLNRKMTNSQQADLLKEVSVYMACGKVISKKDIKKSKDKNGKIVYYVMVNGEKYENEYLKKMKSGRKFLSSKEYEVVNNERKDEIEEKQPNKEDGLIVVIPEKKSGRIAKIIGFIKEKLLKKKSEYIDETDRVSDDKFRKSLIIRDKQTGYKKKQSITPKEIDRDER